MKNQQDRVENQKKSKASDEL